MDSKVPWMEKPIYINSNIKIQDIVGLLGVMFLGVPLLLRQCDQTVTIYTLILITFSIFIIMLIADFIFRTKVLNQIKILHEIEHDIKPISRKLSRFIFVSLMVGSFMLIMSLGFTSIIILEVFYIISKLIAGFSPKLLQWYLSRFRPTFFEDYRAKSVEFKYKLSISFITHLTSLAIINIPIFLRSQDIFTMQPLWHNGLAVYLAVALSVLIMGIDWAYSQRAQVKYMQLYDNYEQFRVNYNRRIWGFLFLIIVLIAIIWLIVLPPCFT